MCEAWGRKVAAIDTKDPEEVELVNRFNTDFVKLLKAIPKTDRRILFDMLNAISKLYNIGLTKKFNIGILCGFKGGLKYLTNQSNKK